MEKILKELLKKYHQAKVSRDVAEQLFSAHIKHFPYEMGNFERYHLDQMQAKYSGLENGYWHAIFELLRSDLVPAEYKKMDRLWFSLELKRYDLTYGAA